MSSVQQPIATGRYSTRRTIQRVTRSAENFLPNRFFLLIDDYSVSETIEKSIENAEAKKAALFADQSSFYFLVHPKKNSMWNFSCSTDRWQFNSSNSRTTFSRFFDQVLKMKKFHWFSTFRNIGFIVGQSFDEWKWNAKSLQSKKSPNSNGLWSTIEESSRK